MNAGWLLRCGPVGRRRACIIPLGGCRRRNTPQRKNLLGNKSATEAAIRKPLQHLVSRHRLRADPVLRVDNLIRWEYPADHGKVLAVKAVERRIAEIVAFPAGVALDLVIRNAL